MRKSSLKNRCVTLLLSLAVAAGMMPFVSAEAFAAYDSADEAMLQEIARQMQDKDSDPFAFRDGGKSLSAAAAYPESFDLRDYDGDGKGDKNPVDDCYVTPVKFQNPFGTCWGFAAIAAAESSILGNEAIRGKETADTLDLSEKHLVWFTYQPIKDRNNPQYGEGGVFDGPNETDSLMLGGYPFYGTSLFATGRGPVLENVNGDGSLEYHGKDRLVTLRDGKERYVKREKDILFDWEKVKMYCYSDTDDWSIPDEDRYLQSYRLKESYLLPTPANKSGEDREEAINAIKEQLMGKRAVQIAFRADTSDPGDLGSPKPTRYVSPNWAHYTYENKSPNHAVTIVGWDDAYPAENFSHKLADGSDAPVPSGNGAWLVKNSWGAEQREFPHKGPGTWGLLEGQDKAPYTPKKNAKHTGYFWISYDDRTVDLVESLDFDISNVEDEYLLYQHDYMPIEEVDSAFLSEKTSMANVFTAELPSRIEQVTCETTTPGTEVHYEVYLLNNNAADPTDGKKVAEMDAEYTYGGFHKENLPEPVTAATGQRFSVVVTQKTPDDLYTINLQASLNKYFMDEYNAQADLLERRQSYSKGVVNEGESYFLLNENGQKWQDLSEKWVQDMMIGRDCKYFDVDNFAIKVYASEAEEPVTDRSGQMGKDGTAFGKGASAEAAEAAALAWAKDTDPAGTSFAPLLLKSGSQGKNSIKLSWKKKNGASAYVIYGARSGSSNKLRRLARTAGSSFKMKNIAGSALKKGKYYKFMIVALDKNNNVISSSKLIHAATKGGKRGNYKSVKLTKPKNAKLSLKKGKSFRIKAKTAGSKVRRITGLRYESSNPAVASVSSGGRIRALSKGSCTVRVYAQNGIYKSIKLRVK